METYSVHYSGACFERGDSTEQVKRRIHDKIDCLGKVLGIEAAAIHPDLRTLGEENYVITFEGEITVEAKTRELAESQAYDRLSYLGQITVVAFKE